MALRWVNPDAKPAPMASRLPRRLGGFIQLAAFDQIEQGFSHLPVADSAPEQPSFDDYGQANNGAGEQRRHDGSAFDDDIDEVDIELFTLP